MDARKFLLSYYENAAEDFHIHTLEEPKAALERHKHDYFQVYFVLNGRIRHYTDAASGELSAGDVCILPPALPHYIEVKSRPLRFFSLSFFPSFVQKLRGQSPMTDDFLSMLSAAPSERIQARVSLPPSDVLFAEELLKRIHLEFEEKRPGHEEMIRHGLGALLTLIARIYLEKNAESLSLEWKKETALHCIEYLQEHFDEHVTLSDMAKRFAMSKTGFCTLFKSVSGSTFKEYLTSFRVQKAVEMLKAGEKPGSVCLRCGFEDFSTFYRNLKKKTGMSPTEIQKS
ncbi:MAG: helix-turn-helix domain-containing protein [Clostridia bacterium]|nr:helix-turn-helix domain-containing protein [Clostridia bacterium]